MSRGHIEGPLEKRGRALEEQFFAKENRRLLEQLRRKRERAEGREALARACGLSREDVLEELQEHGIQAETVVAMALMPLVQVAWANGKVEDHEREALLKAAEQCGVARNSDCHELFEDWLDVRPSPSLFRTWADYTRAMCEQLESEQRESLRRDIVGRARKVAEAAGGFLGLARISREEQRVLEEIDAAF
jgi:hypothetical protein